MAFESTPTSKRQRTRARLVDAALDLCERQGFDGTTVAQIAAAAGVTEMTFFRHFRTKEQVLLDDPYDPVIAAAIADQPRNLPPVARAARGVRYAWNDLPQSAEREIRRRIRIVAQSPTMRGGMSQNNARTEQLVADQLVADGADQLPARVAAAAVLAGITAALLEWSRHDGTSLSASIATALHTLESAHD